MHIAQSIINGGISSVVQCRLALERAPSGVHLVLLEQQAEKSKESKESRGKRHKSHAK